MKSVNKGQKFVSLFLHHLTLTMGALGSFEGSVIICTQFGLKC